MMPPDAGDTRTKRERMLAGDLYIAVGPVARRDKWEAARPITVGDSVCTIEDQGARHEAVAAVEEA